MRNISSFESVSLCFITFLACFVFSPRGNAQTNASLPSWFTFIEKDQSLISDVGVGQTLEQAKEDALLNIAKSMFSQVSASVERHLVTEAGASVVNTTSSYSSVTVDDVILSTVRWTKTELIDGWYYVRGNIRLAEWVALNQNRLSGYLSEVNAIVSKPNWNLSDYRRSLQLDILRIQVLASMLAPFSFETSNTLQMVAALHEKRNGYLERHCFSVKESRDKVTDKYFLPVVESAVYQSELLLSDDSTCEVISVIARNDKIAEDKIRTTLLIQISGYDSYQLEVVGEGESYKTRLISAASNLSSALDQQGGILPN